MTNRHDWIAWMQRAWLAAMLSFMAAPILFVVINSFNTSPFSAFPPTGFSLQWYVKALGYAPFQSGIANSLIVSTGATLLALAAGIPASMALVRHRFRGREMLQALLISPLVLPKVAIGLGAFVVFLLVLDFLGVGGPLFQSPLTLVPVHAAIALPIVIVIMSASLVRMDPTLEEAAADLGANPLRTFVRVTLPLTQQGIVFAGVFAFMFSFDEVEAAVFMRPIAGGTFPVEMFVFLEAEHDPTLAALSTMLLAGVFAVVLGLSFRFGLARVVTTARRLG